MSVEKIDTLVVGAGQAGIALSEHLGALGVPHLILEKNRIAEAWRSGRWDKLVTNGPVWHDRFPNLEFEGEAPDAFASKDRPGPRIFLNLVGVYCELKNFDNAKKVLSRAVGEFSNSPEEVRVMLAQSDLSMKMGDTKKALNMLKKISPESRSFI